MIDDPGPSIPSASKKERAASIEEEIGLLVSRWVQGRRRLKHLTPTELQKAASSLELKVRKTIGDEAPDDLLAAVTLELKHQIREVTESKENRTRRIHTIGDFLDEDLRAAVRAGVEKAAEAGVREPHLLGSIAAETNLEVHQLLLHAKKEFSDTASTTHNPVVREAVLCKVQALEEETTAEKMAGELAKGLGIPFIARIRRQLHHATGPEQIANLLDAAGHQAAQQFEHPLVRTQVLEDLRHLRELFLD